MLVINSIEKTRLSADSFSYSGSGVAWKARLVLFLGFALMAGGLAGSVTVMVLKYLFKDYPLRTMYMGVANVVANGLVMLRYVLLSQVTWCETSYANLAIVVPSYYGCHRTWRMTIHTIWRCDHRSGICWPLDWELHGAEQGIASISIEIVLLGLESSKIFRMSTQLSDLFKCYQRNLVPNRWKSC